LEREFGLRIRARSEAMGFADPPSPRHRINFTYISIDSIA
jgi:hypothetical protein